MIDCDDLNQGTRHLERIARDVARWRTDNTVKFEASKTEVILFSRRRMVLQAAKDAVVHIGELSSTIKQEATKMARLLARFEAVLQDALREQDGERQGCSAAGG